MSLEQIIEANRAATLGKYFRRVVTASIAAAAIGLVGCTNVHAIDPADFEGPVCVDGSHQVVNGLMTPAAWEYVGAFRPIVFLGGDFEGPDGELIHARGEMCASATDRESCEAEAGRLDFGVRHIVATNGDTVSRFQTHAEVVEFLGSVDTEQEALLVAWHGGYNIECNNVSRGGVRVVEGGFEVVATQLTNDCPFEITQFLLSVGTEGTVEVLSSEIVEMNSGCAGRRPDAWISARGNVAAPPVARYLASMAHLEAGAVLAFENLVRELVAHGAPASLIRDARAAVRDEVVHTELMTALSEAHGVTPPTAEVTTVRVRSLYEMALDNATEGCVRETYGALVGMYQATAAGDRELARAMRQIAQDETRHASLSWRIGEWLLEQLSEAQRAVVLEAQRDAVLELRQEVSAEPDRELLGVVGLPPARVAVAMVDQLAKDLWH